VFAMPQLLTIRLNQNDLCSLSFFFIFLSFLDSKNFQERI
jgi:hypothetical protein